MKPLITNVLAAIAALAAVYFGMEQARKFEALRTTRLELIATNERVTADADATEKKLKDETDLHDQAVAARDALNTSLATLREQERGYRSQIAAKDALIAQLEEQKRQMEEAREKMIQIVRDLGEDPDPDNLDRTLAQVEDQKKNREARIKELEASIAKFEELLAKHTAERDRLVQREVGRVTKMVRCAMTAVVTGVNQEWGFLVIGAGSNTGFTPQSSLIVQREGKMIARVRPSAIEPTQTIAEINFNSLAPGVRIQPGDLVIYETPGSN